MNDFFLDDDDFYLIIKVLGHLAECDCTETLELMQTAKLIEKIERITTPVEQDLEEEWVREHGEA